MLNAEFGMLNEMAKRWQSVAFGHGKRLLRSREAMVGPWEAQMLNEQLNNQDRQENCFANLG